MVGINLSLQKLLENFPYNVWSTYGMTETLSHIALRRINGDQGSDWYTPFENVNIALSENKTLMINAPSLCDEVLITNDVEKLIKKDSLNVLGRLDNIINSGGIKIQIESLEATLLPIMENPFLLLPCLIFNMEKLLLFLLKVSMKSLKMNSIGNFMQFCLVIIVLNIYFL